MDTRKNVYAIYAAADDQLVTQLLHRLKSLEKDSDISIWDDEPIQEGQVWKPQDESRIAKADIFLLMLSKNFMYSEFIKQLEFKNIIDSYKEGKSEVIPILLEECPWEIDFEADDYTFNFNELQVLPEDRKPVKNWNSEEEAIQQIFKKLKLSITGEVQDEIEAEGEPEVSNSEGEDQLALNFAKEEEAKRLAKEEKSRNKREAEAKQKAEKEQRLSEEAAEKRLKEEKRLQKEAEAKRMAEEERLRQEAEEQRRFEEETRLREQEVAAAYNNSDNNDDSEGQEANSGNKKRILAGLLAAAFVIAAIVTFSRSEETSAEEPILIPEDVEVKGPVAQEKIEAETQKKEETLTLLTIGEIYEGGFVFEISNDGKSGKIAHIDDAGPMPWQDAMIIHDQLGAGWRLPTFDELLLMQKTIGQGAENKGEFDNGLYWSATPYDDYQARLIRFRDGNTSYHYNSGGDHRKFLVRAIRDFSR